MRVRADRIFYEFGKLAWIPLVLFGFWFAAYGYETYGEYVSCSVLRVSGVPCPGCGGTRAFYYLFSGDFSSSLRYHPAVIYGLFSYAHFMGLYFYRKHIAKTIGAKEIQIPFYVYGAAAVILLQWILKLTGITGV